MKLKNLILLLLIFTAVIANPSFAGNDNSEAVPVQGTVLGEDGEPLAGVAIRVQGYSEVIYTNFDGQFEIFVPKSGKLNISVSTIAYKDKQIAVELPNKEKPAPLTITLESQGRS